MPIIYGDSLDLSTNPILNIADSEILTSAVSLARLKQLEEKLNFVVRSQEFIIGNGIDQQYLIQHDFNGDLVAWSVVRISDGEYIQVAPKRVDANTVLLEFGSVIALDSTRVKLSGIGTDNSLLNQGFWSIDSGGL